MPWRGCSGTREFFFGFRILFRRGREKRKNPKTHFFLFLFLFPSDQTKTTMHSGWAGWGIFTASYAAAISFLLPGVAAVLGAGFVFGFWRGLLAVWVGGAAGQVGAFLLSRYLLGRSVSGLLKGSRLWASVDAAIESGEGWKLLLLLRLSPVIPYNLLNLAAAATSVGLVPFALASAVGIVPECTLLVYAGERIRKKRGKERERGRGRAASGEKKKKLTFF